MPAFTATAPGKIILLGEHAVVYGQPALAVPVRKVRARAVVRAEIGQKAETIHLLAPEIDLDTTYDTLEPGNPLRLAIAVVLDELGISRTPACSIRIQSTIPMASGLGSSAAVSVAVIRALSGFLGHPLSREKVSALAFEVEKIHHGTPSGIDNTVVTFDKPVFFSKDDDLQILSIGKSFTFVIGDTGIPSATAHTVASVRKAYHAEQQRYEDLFSSIGSLVLKAQDAIQEGKSEVLGLLMDENHVFLKEMGVSIPELDQLVGTAKKTGALGAKLSGGGGGGNMIALVNPNQADMVANSLEKAGAAQTIITHIEPS